METITEPEPKTKIKIPAVEIHIPFMEGRAEWSNQTFVSCSARSCWDKFQDYMKTISNTYSLVLVKRQLKWLGYLKTDFVVTFADGEEYGGRYDLQEDGLDGGETLAQHIKNFCLFYSGLVNLSQIKHMQNAAAYSVFLDNYDIPA